MKNKKHKIFLYPVEENGMIKVLLFQSGDIGTLRGRRVPFVLENFTVMSAACPSTISDNVIYVNGWSTSEDFTIPDIEYAKQYTKEEFAKLKELEHAYNNR